MNRNTHVFLSIRNSSLVIRNWSLISGGIEPARSTAVLAFPAAMGITGSAYFPLLQRQPACSMTAAALPGAFTMRASSMGFRHFTPP
jgi:hypothetical protein